MTKKTKEEEDAILESIDNVSHNLSDQVSELQMFLKDLRRSRQNKKMNRPFLPDEQGGAQHG